MRHTNYTEKSKRYISIIVVEVINDATSAIHGIPYMVQSHFTGTNGEGQKITKCWIYVGSL